MAAATEVSVRAQVRRIEENFGNGKPYKRQKSERTETAEFLEKVLHLGPANQQEDGSDEESELDSFDAVDGFREFLSGVENVIRAVSPTPLLPQIGPLQSDEEVFENNILIKHPECETDDIQLGVHLSEHEMGYIVRRILRRELLESKVLRVGDIVKIVGDTDVTSLPIEELKAVFWEMDIDVALTLVVLREPEDETDSSEERSEYEIVTVSLKLEKNDTDIKFEAETVVRTAAYMTWEPSPEKYFIAVKEGGDSKYMCIQDDQPKMEQLVDRDNESDFYWKKQITLGPDGVSRDLLLHQNTEKTICCDLDATQNVAFVKLSSRGFLPKGLTSEEDIRWIVREPVQGEQTTSVYYMKCSTHADFYMGVDEEPSDQGRLLYARISSQHPKRKFFFYTV